jgi:hypothetical protein
MCDDTSSIPSPKHAQNSCIFITNDSREPSAKAAEAQPNDDLPGNADVSLAKSMACKRERFTIRHFLVFSARLFRFPYLIGASSFIRLVTTYGL